MSSLPVSRATAATAASSRTAGVAVRRRWRGPRDRRVVIGGGVFALICLLAIMAPVLGRYDPTYGDFSQVLAPPSAEHFFGTDAFGRDIWARVLTGFRVSLVVSVSAVALAILIGLPLGLLAGYFGNTVDNVIMRPLDLLMAFPPILLAVLLIAVFGTGELVLILALGLIYVPIVARVIRGSVLAVRREEFVEAAAALGARPLRIMGRHVLPNSLSALIIQVSISIGIAILIEASLSFIGLGTQPPDPSLGSMLTEGRDFMRDAPWVVVFPGLAIMAAVLACNLLGDGLRDSLDRHR